MSIYSQKSKSCFLLFLLLFLFFFFPVNARAEVHPSGSWTTQNVISHGAVLDLDSMASSLGLEPAELMSLQLSPYGFGKMLFCGVVYPVELRVLGTGIYALTESDTNLLLSFLDDNSLICTLQGDFSFVLTPAEADPNYFDKGLPVSTVLSEAKAAQSLSASLRSTALNLSFPFSDLDTTAMSNFMLQGRYWFDGTFLYGLAFDKNDILPNLVRMEVSFSDAAPQPGTCEPLDRHVNAVFLTPVDNCLYYIRHDREMNTVSLVRLDLNTFEVEVLSSDHSELSYLQLHNGRLYFTAENHRLFSSDLDGKNLQLILEKEVYYPYFLDDDRLLYQDAVDGESLHLFRCSDGTDIKITNTPSFHPILSGTNLYFLSAENDILHLSCMDLSNPSPDTALPFPIETSSLPFSQEFSISGGKLCYNGITSADLVSWAQLSDDSEPTLSLRILYIGNSFLISAEMDDYGGRNVRELYLVDSLTGQEGVFHHVY